MTVPPSVPATTREAETVRVGIGAPHAAQSKRKADAHAALAVLVAAAERTEAVEADNARLTAERDALEDCDCIPLMVSSKACDKCGRRGIIPGDSLLKLQARAEAAEAEVERLRPVVHIACLMDDASGETPLDTDKVWNLCERLHEAIRTAGAALGVSAHTQDKP